MGKGEKTRQFIIEKAAPIINRKGMAGTSMSDIMQATNLAKGCLYGNFENKDEICLEAFNFLSKSYVETLQQHLKKFDSAKEKLFAYLDFSLQDKLRDENGGCPVINFGVESDDTNPVIRERVKQAIRGSQEMIRKLIVLGIDRGEFQPIVDPEVLALKFYAMLEGAVFISRIDRDSAHLAKITTLIKGEINEMSQ